MLTKSHDVPNMLTSQCGFGFDACNLVGRMRLEPSGQTINRLTPHFSERVEAFVFGVERSSRVNACEVLQLLKHVS